VPFLVGESDDLVFNGRAIPGPNTLDYPGVQRRFVQVGADDPGCGIGCIGNMAWELTIDSLQY
jgi:hypothetical protein